MARPKYPSDEARRQRPHAKVHLSWMHHPRYAAAFADVEVRGIILGLWMFAAQAHASATGDRVTLNHGVMAAITGRERRDKALSTLRRACDLMRYPLSYDGDTATIHVRNFSKKQGFTPHHSAESPQTPAPSEEPKNQGTKEPSKNATPSRRTRGDPSRWASMFASEPDPPPEGVEAWIAQQLPVIEGEADAAFPRGAPDERAWTGKVRSLLWRYWKRRHGDRSPPNRGAGRAPIERLTVNERTKRELEQRRAAEDRRLEHERAQGTGGSHPRLVAGVAADGAGGAGPLLRRYGG